MKGRLAATIFAAMCVTGMHAPAQDATTNAPATSGISTNSAPSPAAVMEGQPDLTQPTPPVPGGTGGLSLQPDAGTTNAPPVVAPSGPEIFPEVPPVPPIGQVQGLAGHLLVVYNENDPDSGPLAKYYASRRNIPDERVLGISCPATEEVTREQYEETIRSPILGYLAQKYWLARSPQRVRLGDRILDILVATHNDIWAIVLIRGVPLKIASDPNDQDGMESQPELQTNAAAVDNELALLPVFGLPKGGYVPNPFFDNQVAGLKHAGPEQATNMVLVTRLDGPTVADVRRMIDDTIEAETHRLAGLAVIDTRGFTDEKNGYTIGDVWLRKAAESLVHDGWAVKFDDSPEVLPAWDPLNEVAIYLGWYHEGAIGPWVTPPNRFVPGAIAYHLHSYSATTVRSETVGWVGPLIAHGADATMGMVYEPYLFLTPHEDIFARRILQGDYFAEAAYAAEPGLSWMLTVVGDPLYRPFLQPLDSALGEAGQPRTRHDDWLLLQKVGRELEAGRLIGTPENLKAALDLPGATAVAEEGLGDYLEKMTNAKAGPLLEEAYQKAYTGETLPMDRIRVGLKLAQYYSSHGKEDLARHELEMLRVNYTEEAKRFGMAGPLIVPTPTARAKTW
jgi:uncharacterized protein (TIGR03790 family)